MDGEVSSTTSGSSLPKCFPELIHSTMNFSHWSEGADLCRTHSVSVRVHVCVSVHVCVCPYVILKVIKEQNKNSEGKDIASQRSTCYNNDCLLRWLCYKANIKLPPNSPPTVKTGSVLVGAIKGLTADFCSLRTLKTAHASHTPPSSFSLLEALFSSSDFYPSLVPGAWEMRPYSNHAPIPELRFCFLTYKNRRESKGLKKNPTTQKWEGRDKLGDWDWLRHTTIYKIDN